MARFYGPYTVYSVFSHSIVMYVLNLLLCSVASIRRHYWGGGQRSRRRMCRDRVGQLNIGSLESAVKSPSGIRSEVRARNKFNAF